MFVVRRAFRNYGQMVLPGSIVEPVSIKWFKTRVKDRNIIEVTAHNFDYWSKYFKDKFGVQLRDIRIPEVVAEATTEVAAEKEVAPKPKERVVVKAVFKE